MALTYLEKEVRCPVQDLDGSPQCSTSSDSVLSPDSSGSWKRYNIAQLRAQTLMADINRRSALLQLSINAGTGTVTTLSTF